MPLSRGEGGRLPRGEGGSGCACGANLRQPHAPIPRNSSVEDACRTQAMRTHALPTFQIHSHKSRPYERHGNWHKAHVAGLCPEDAKQGQVSPLRTAKANGHITDIPDSLTPPLLGAADAPGPRVERHQPSVHRQGSPAHQERPGAILAELHRCQLRVGNDGPPGDLDRPDDPGPGVLAKLVFSRQW